MSREQKSGDRGAAGAAARPGSGPGPGSGRDQRDDRPVLPEKASDDTDEGWGEQTEDRDEQFRRDRPPHWD